jgi:hypothetical protein
MENKMDVSGPTAAPGDKFVTIKNQFLVSKRFLKAKRKSGNQVPTSALMKVSG